MAHNFLAENKKPGCKAGRVVRSALAAFIGIDSAEIDPGARKLGLTV